jgi:hypothetical protein
MNCINFDQTIKPFKRKIYLNINIFSDRQFFKITLKLKVSLFDVCTNYSINYLKLIHQME